MSDLISREAAIEIASGFCHPANIAKELAKLPSAQPEPHWTPCSERLPEEEDGGILRRLGTTKVSDGVLITVDVRGERMTDIGCTYDGVWQWQHKYAFPGWKVIAWMPLPEPYREEQE